MKCPHCLTNDDRVLDTRILRDGTAIRRRRECLHCKSRFTTQELLVQDLPMVIKKDGRREGFLKEKVKGGIKAACQKRPISLTQVDQAVEKVTQWTLERTEKEVPASAIGQQVMLELRKLDDVAYVRFASVYKSFSDIRDFVEKLEQERKDLSRDSAEW